MFEQKLVLVNFYNELSLHFKKIIKLKTPRDFCGSECTIVNHCTPKVVGARC